MSRASLFRVLLLAMAAALALAACDDRVTVPDAKVWTPALLRGTINDSILVWATFEGDSTDIARASWDMTSDGIFDMVVTGPTAPQPILSFRYAYARAGSYMITLQVTTVTNEMYRTTMDVRITDLSPRVEASVPDRLACGEQALITATVIDDAGFKAWWDLDANGSPDTVVDFTDTMDLDVSYTPTGPGIRSVVFGALDNDEHRFEERFDMVVGLEPAWAPAEESPSAMDQGRWAHASAVHDGKIYVFGGRDGGDVLDHVEIYDPVADAWTEGAPMPSPRYDARAFAYGDSIYVAGGYEPNGAVHLRIDAYHPATDSWADYDPADAGKTMPEARIGFGLDERRHVGEPGYLLLFGGFSAGEPRSFSMKYGFGSGRWTHDFTNEMRFPRRDFGFAELGGYTWAAGGSEDGAQPSARLERYDPGPKVWVIQANMPTARRHPAMASYGQHLYVFGGSTSTAAACKVLEVYDRQTRAWSTGPELPVAISSATAHVLDDRIYLIGGRGPDSMLGKLQVWVLTPWRCGE